MDDYGFDGDGGDIGYDGGFDPAAGSMISDGSGYTGYDGGFDPAAGSMISNGDITDVL